MLRKSLLLMTWSAALVLAACGGDGAGGAPVDSGPGTDSQYPDWYTPSDSSGNDGAATTSPTCGFDKTKQGRTEGTHIADFELEDAFDKPHRLHDDCGTEKKAIWIVLAAGW